MHMEVWHNGLQIFIFCIFTNAIVYVSMLLMIFRLYLYILYSVIYFLSSTPVLMFSIDVVFILFIMCAQWFSGCKNILKLDMFYSKWPIIHKQNMKTETWLGLFASVFKTGNLHDNVWYGCQAWQLGTTLADKYSLLMHCIKIKSPVRFFFEWAIYCSGWIYFYSIYVPSCSSKEA